MPLGFLGSQGDNDSYRIERSLRFNSADSAYLNRTFPAAGNLNTWTLSFWMKPSSSVGTIFSTANILNTNNALGQVYFSSGSLRFFQYNGTTTYTDVTTTQVFRDFSAWYHIVIRYDDTQATASNRVRIYVNGSIVTAFSTANYPSQNFTGFFNNAQPHLIGQYAGSGQADFINLYLAEMHFVPGQSLDSSSFGETDAVTGRWKAKAYSGSYGTNGFYLKFADNSGVTATTLGKDSSPNGNNWTPNNFSVTAGVGNDSLVDSPTNYGTDAGVGGEVRGNYCTLNRLDFSCPGTISNGNLQYVQSTLNPRGGRSTMAVSYGKWYWEVTNNGGNNSVGIIRDTGALTSYIGANADGWSYFIDGLKYNNGTGTSYGASYTTNDVIGVALNMDAGTLVFYKNGVSQGTAFSGLSGTMSPGFSSSSTSAVSFTVNFGQRPFAYTAPTGFKALCTTNLPTPTIKKPSSYMDVLTYTGNGAASQDITSLSFSPDLVWLKSRTDAYDHRLKDSTRGDFALFSNLTNAESAYSLAFLSNGIRPTLGYNDNISSKQYVAWAWDESPIAGMDIVGYTGTGSATTIAHSLGVAPKMMIVKSRSRAGDNWDVYHASVGATGRLYLNLTNATDTSIAPWNNTAPTSSVFTVGTAGDTNATGVTYIAYLFAEVEGFSKFGSYTGNGVVDGPFVWCGFRPRWVMVKMTNAAGEDWQIQDSVRSVSNPAQNNLFADLSLAELVGGADRNYDFVSNGFKLRGNNRGPNDSGGTYIFAAFAESPFKYARAR